MKKASFPWELCQKWSAHHAAKCGLAAIMVDDSARCASVTSTEVCRSDARKEPLPQR